MTEASEQLELDLEFVPDTPLEKDLRALKIPDLSTARLMFRVSKMAMSERRLHFMKLAFCQLRADVKAGTKSMSQEAFEIIEGQVSSMENAQWAKQTLERMSKESLAVIMDEKTNQHAGGGRDEKRQA